ncbi:hypothetical protein [Natronobeatus ordinarius]|uniref:hypothetical protein n=1 Tax=Natronobeatus ordinarius TaxID=2963433 RepID=UPI0020CCF8B7|nr:hypothetical protein [Natronobeatus ordinarius]
MTRWTAVRSSPSRIQVAGILGVLLLAVSIGLLFGAVGGVTAGVESADHEATGHADGVEVLEDDLEGDGTPDDPYRIHGVDELQAINQNLSAHYELSGDIDASETANWNGGDGFEPIGDRMDDDPIILIADDESDPFTGSFDGNGYVISNLTIDRTDENDIGLFGVAAGATIESVELENPFVKGDENVGAVVGELTDGELHDVTVTDGYVRAYYGSNGGGLVGTLVNGTVDSAHVDGQVRGSGDYIGGLVGVMDTNDAFHTSVVQNSASAADVDGGMYVGGAVGEIQSGYVANTYTAGNVTGDYEETIKAGYRFGGLVGSINEGVVERSYATGDVNGSNQVGGLVGNVGSSGQVTETYATGMVTGDVTDDSDHGGLIGQNDGDVTDSYWDFENSPELAQNDGVGSGDTTGITGLSTDDMTGEDAEDNLLEFDFADTWTTTDSYPALAWELEHPLTPYTDGDGIVGTDGLRDAIDDWRGGEIDTDLLRDVIDAWRSGDPVV